MDAFGKLALNHPNLVVAIIVLGLAALPVAIWLDLRHLSDQTLRIQATNLDSIISEVRGYYSRNVVGRIKQNSGPSQALHNYHDVPGAIPIPATLSLELGDLISKSEGNVDYRFVSDHSFTNRAPHVLDEFEIEALSTFRHPENTEQVIAETSGSFFHRKIRIATPVMLAGSCVKCHNQHPLSPKHDWVIGDVRGIQEVVVRQPIAANLFSFNNTGYCNVGNFGSAERMDYTIIGAEANLAARLEVIAEPGGIVMSYETFVLVQHIVEAEQLEPTKFKGISREVIPYAVKSTVRAPDTQNVAVMDEQLPGIRLFLDVEAMDGGGIKSAEEMLKNALKAVNSYKDVNPETGV